MTDKEKIKDLLVDMANSEWCDNAAKRKIQNDILPLIDSLPEKPELTKFETELLSIMAEYGVEKASDDDIRREAKRLLKIARSIPVEWSEEDERIRNRFICGMRDLEENGSTSFAFIPLGECISWLKSLRPQINVTDEELAQAKKDAYNEALDKIEYHSGEPTFDDGWSAAIWYLKKRNAQPQNSWKPSGYYLGAISDAIRLYKAYNVDAIELKELLEDLKELTD